MTDTTYNQLNFVTSNRFYVEIKDLQGMSSIAASFSECSGLSVQIKKNVFQEGGVNDRQVIYLGHTELADVTLKRGIADRLGFWSWLNEIFDENTPLSRRNVNILVFNQAGETMMSWTLIGAVPITWKTPTLQADGNAVAIEELTLAYEGLKIGKDKGGGHPVKREKTGFFPSK
jgi:phage tail-like protein